MPSGHSIRVGDFLTFQWSRPPLHSRLVVEKIDRKNKIVKCSERCFGQTIVLEIPLRKLTTCVGAFLRGREGVMESYRWTTTAAVF